MIMFLIIGAIFFAVGLGLLSSYFWTRKYGFLVDGTVGALKKNTGSSNGNSGGYQPIVDYIYDGKVRRVGGITSGQLRHKLGETVQVYVISTAQSGKVQATLKDNSNIFKGLMFALGGLAFALIYYFDEAAIKLAAYVALVLAILAGLILPIYMREKLYSSDAIGEVDQSINFAGVENIETFDRSQDLIDTEEGYQRELNRENVMMIWLGCILLIAGCGLLIGTYIRLNGTNFSAAEIQATFSSFDGFYERLRSKPMEGKWETVFIMLGMGGLFMLISLQTLISQWRKIRLSG